ncbi:MAG TPA: hypothetical protein DDY13_02260 [Cytophagales bacterium]|jgi:predicted DCC family thiol-disulfide oxidoreductase YuxK|nr:hypothetical protein [Cytophagales bacterium]
MTNLLVIPQFLQYMERAAFHTEYPIVFYDGSCRFCNNTVKLVIKLDRHANIRFAALQSDLATQLLSDTPHLLEDMKSFILWENGTVYLRSDAAIKLAAYLPNPWKAFRFFRFVPRSIRDALYDVIARNRYKWFGRYDECLAPTPDIKMRFLDI